VYKRQVCLMESTQFQTMITSRNAYEMLAVTTVKPILTM